ncbi:MAG: hypothetical protein HRT61_05960 [Ekhidna sp.]|nr:hypothetical protein [Ekhidna sp.]
MEEVKKPLEILVAIINHNHNKEGIALKSRFSQHIDTVLIDSGSTFSGEEEKDFDFTLPNVYYNGLLNKAYECFIEKHSHLFLITSDVEIEDISKVLDRIKWVYENNGSVSVYAPSAKHSTHKHQNNLGSNHLRKVTFTEGFCFVMPREFLDEICPIDLEINRIGHGIDMYMGFLAMSKKKLAVVDDLITVDHPHGSGYSGKQARIERDRWYATKSKEAQKYHYWISKDILKNRLGYWFIKNIIMGY